MAEVEIKVLNFSRRKCFRNHNIGPFFTLMQVHGVDKTEKWILCFAVEDAVPG
jgi:hypothetical protein